MGTVNSFTGGALLIVLSSTTFAAQLPESRNRNEQWPTGYRCKVIDELVCGQDVDYFCEKETGICTPCNVYCSDQTGNHEKCKQFCPVWLIRNANSAHASQWLGDCDKHDGLTCGLNNNYFCEKETQICTKCSVYCNEPYDLTCKKKCPAFTAIYAEKPLPTTIPVIEWLLYSTDNADRITRTRGDTSKVGTTIGGVTEIPHDKIGSWYWYIVAIVILVAVSIIVIVLVLFFTRRLETFKRCLNSYRIIYIVKKDITDAATNVENVQLRQHVSNPIITQPIGDRYSKPDGHCIHYPGDDAGDDDVPTSALMPQSDNSSHTKLNASATARCQEKNLKAEPYPVQSTTAPSGDPSGSSDDCDQQLLPSKKLPV